MAVAYTVTERNVTGNLIVVHGTFTSAAGDGNGETLGATTHGLNYIVDYDIKLDTGGLNVPTPKVTISSGTLTWTVDDTLGYSGKWYVKGR
jgi:hypothetical protein